jgi:hypothetical protein
MAMCWEKWGPESHALQRIGAILRFLALRWPGSVRCVLAASLALFVPAARQRGNARASHLWKGRLIA